MAKAILVMDMPSSCLHCSCSNIVHGRSRCEETGESLTVDDIYKERPKYCPLREVPQKKELMTKPKLPTHEFDVRLGYNACIDDILGGDDIGQIQIRKTTNQEIT